MKITLDHDAAYGEDGPNVIFKVNNAELLSLIELVEKIISNKIGLLLSERINIDFVGCDNVAFLSSQENEIKIAVDGIIYCIFENQRWIEILGLINSLKDGPGFQYIELDGIDLSVNWVIENYG